MSNGALQESDSKSKQSATTTIGCEHETHIPHQVANVYLSDAWIFVPFQLYVMRKEIVSHLCCQIIAELFNCCFNGIGVRQEDQQYLFQAPRHTTCTLAEASTDSP